MMTVMEPIFDMQALLCPLTPRCCQLLKGFPLGYSLPPPDEYRDFLLKESGVFSFPSNLTLPE